MFKTAPRYLSGVSVFYGDDITRRNVTGEIAFIVGQAIKGPRTPIALQSVDNAVSLYGKDSPLLKALYEFWDGYIDSPKAQNIQLVTLRTGGTEASLVTPFGVTIQTVDAYTGVENDYNLYINNNSSALNIKAWDTNKQKVLDLTGEVDGGYLTVVGTLNGAGGVYGKDLDADPYDTPASLVSIMAAAMTTNPITSFVEADGTTSATSTYNSATDTTTFSIPLSAAGKAKVVLGGGWIYINKQVAATKTPIYLKYTSATITGPGADFVVEGNVVLDLTVGITNTVYVSAFALTIGDSGLTTDPRTKYEMFRNGLLEIEQFTPDYIVPAGVYFNETDTYDRVYTYNTSLVQQHTDSATAILVDGAAEWQTTGIVELYDGEFTDKVTYSSVATSGADYLVTLDFPTGIATATTTPTSGASMIVTGTAADLAKLSTSGYFKDSGSKLMRYTSVTVSGNGAAATLTLDPVFNSASASGTIASGTVTKVIGSAGVNYYGFIVSHSFTKSAKRELGVGYVKETDIGGSYTFDWADTVTVGYNLAHFGYLFANFCNEAAIGYNTPICGMNVDISELAAGQFTRPALVSWIGTYPTYRKVPGVENAYSSVLTAGTGLLGDAVAAGTPTYNRTGYSDIGNAVYADPGLGLLLTAEGFIDGTVIRDNFYNLVDLGKFMLVGAGLLTFANGASSTSYINACGAYALGMLAGKQGNQGLSFSQIGVQSNAGVSVVVHRKYYNDLANNKFIVVSREKGLGWVLNNGDSIARDDSGYKLISTTRILKYVVEGKRSVLSSFIGKALNQYYYEAAKTKLAASFKDDVKNGMVNGYTFDLQVEATAAAIGKLYLKIAVNPPFELTQVTIDTVIDRTITTT